MPCDEAGWVKIEDILNNDFLRSNRKRNLDWPLNHRHVEERRRPYNRPLQTLFDRSHINARNAHNAKIRLQLLGIRIADPPNANHVTPNARPFDDVLVDATVQRQK